MRAVLSFLLKLAGLLALAVGLSMLTGVALTGYWLQEADEPAPSDAIVVLGGSYFRCYEAADLYKRGLAPRILVSRVKRFRRDLLLEELGYDVPRQEEVYIHILEKRGVPRSAVTLYGDDILSTVMEAREAGRVLGPGRHKLLVVTSPYHVYRARIIFRDTLPDLDIRVVGTPYESLPKQWWTDKESAMAVVTETVKILFYKLGGRFGSDQAEPNQPLPGAAPGD
jgi:uncharacterized SAM-binding protein YcdF (DUF218 family)